MTLPIHRTKIEDATPPSGWRALPKLGLEVSAPLWDVRPPLEGIDFARLTYRDAVRLADERGMQLLSADALEAMREGATVLRPVTLPATNDMRSAEWSRRHDERVSALLEGVHGPVIGIGKHWIAGAPPGRAWLMGWWVDDVAAYGSTRKGPGWVQPRPAPGSRGAHDDLHHDYATTTILMRPMLRPEWPTEAIDAALALARSMFLGDAKADGPGDAIVRVALSQVGIREATGRNDGPQIARYFEGCTRTVGGRELATGWATGWDWCAAFASWVLHVAGAKWIGRRIAVRELCEDARAAGRLETSPSYRPKPGDLWIGARGGGDPLLGGTGHVRVFVAAASASEYRGIGGNEANAVTDAVHRYADPTWRAWIRST